MSEGYYPPLKDYAAFVDDDNKDTLYTIPILKQRNSISGEERIEKCKVLSLKTCNNYRETSLMLRTMQNIIRIISIISNGLPYFITKLLPIHFIYSHVLARKYRDFLSCNMEHFQ